VRILEGQTSALNAVSIRDEAACVRSLSLSPHSFLPLPPLFFSTETLALTRARIASLRAGVIQVAISTRAHRHDCVVNCHDFVGDIYFCRMYATEMSRAQPSTGGPTPIGDRTEFKADDKSARKFRARSYVRALMGSFFFFAHDDFLRRLMEV